VTGYIKGRKHIEAEIQERRKRLFDGHLPELVEALQLERPALNDAIIVDHIIEQCEDIYTVLVDPATVVIVEIARDTAKIIRSVEIRSASEYARGLSARKSRQFVIARELMSQPIA
jgi:hypothetical protein